MEKIMNAVQLTDATFKSEVVDSTIPVLVDFWATWCGPCKAIAPVIEEIAGEYAGKLKVGKVDVDANQAVAMQYQIRSIPTLLIFKGGTVVEQIVGAVPKKSLLEKLSKHL